MHDVETLTEEEQLRLRALRELNILDTPEEKEFDNLAALAAHICEVPFAQINFIDQDRLWSKAKFGIPMRELPRELSFCNHTIREKEHMVVNDASKDERFKHFPFVEEEPNIRFYAGFNIKGEQDLNLGTICVLGTSPKKLSEAQYQALNTLAREVEARIELHQKNKVLETTATFLESSVDMMLIVDPETQKVERVSNNVISFFGLGSRDVDSCLSDLFPDNHFINTVSEWDDDGAKGKITPIAHLSDQEGGEVFLEITVKKQSRKWFMSARNVSEEVAYRNQLEKLVDEKNVLLGEVHHRVKNNLAVISGILQLEELKTESEEVQQALYGNYMRVKSMALIHEEMYRENDFTNIQFDEYLTNFAEELKTDKRSEEKNISIKTDIKPLLLNLNQAVPCALIVNELVSNAFKFAFEGREQGMIELGLESRDDNVILTIRDNGIGLPENFDLPTSPTLGTTLVYSYSEQLDSTIEIDSVNGTEFRIIFRKNDQAVGSSSHHAFSRSA